MQESERILFSTHQSIITIIAKQLGSRWPSGRLAVNSCWNSEGLESTLFFSVSPRDHVISGRLVDSTDDHLVAAWAAKVESSSDTEMPECLFGRTSESN